jgi:hypothetical protein
MKRPLPLGLTGNVISRPQAFPGSASGDCFKTHIERLACLIGRGVATPSTVPAEEIEQAEALLLRIGIAVPKTARAMGHIPETSQPPGNPSKVRRTRATLSRRGVRV